MEQHHTPPSPIAGEPAMRTPLEVVKLAVSPVDWQLRRVENISTCLLEAMSGHDEWLNIRTAFMELKALEDHIRGIAMHNNKSTAVE